MTERDYKRDLKIDVENLEDEWLEQPSLYMYYAEELAEAMDIRDRLKQKLEVTYAELDAKVRIHYSNKEEKITEPNIKSKIQKHKKYLEVQDQLHEAIKNVNILTSAKTAFEHRKKALENIVSLRITSYHAEPRARKIQEEEVRKEHKRQLNKGRAKQN